MEHTTDHSTPTGFLLGLIILIHSMSNSELATVLNIIVALMLLVINGDKLWDVIVKWYTRVSSWFKKK